VPKETFFVQTYFRTRHSMNHTQWLVDSRTKAEALSLKLLNLPETLSIFLIAGA